MYMLSNTPVFKIIENQKQGSYFKAQVLVPVENAKNKPEGM